MSLLRHVADVSDLELAWITSSERLQVEGKNVHVTEKYRILLPEAGETTETNVSMGPDPPKVLFGG
jgi:hypothetical protein